MRIGSLPVVLSVSVEECLVAFLRIELAMLARICSCVRPVRLKSLRLTCPATWLAPDTPTKY